MARQTCLSPRIEVREHDVFFDNRPLGLCRRPLMRRLFELFTASPETAIDRSALLKDLYDQNDQESYSERYRQSASQNLVKLISRARRSVTEAAAGWEWFVYDAHTERWHLYGAKEGHTS